MNEELKKKMQELKVSEAAIAKLDEQELTTEEQLTGMTYEQLLALGIKAGSAKILAENFKAKVEAIPTATATPMQASLDVLPAVPDDTSFIEMLKIGGTLKVQTVDVIAAMRAAIGAKVGLFELPDVLIARMEEFANEQEEPLGESFFRLQKLITTRQYGEILSAMGVSGTFVSDRRKKEMLERLNTLLWPALQGYQAQLKAWADTWAQTGSNPAMILSALAMGMSGAKGIMPPGMMQPPDTAGLRDEAEAVVNRINKVFAGTGIPVARAMGYDAVRIREVLEEPTLPAAIGAATKDHMLKMLCISVGADFVRLERNLVRYALAIMELPKVTAGNEELAYLGAMLQLGAAIPWDKLGGRGGLKEDDANSAAPFRSRRKPGDQSEF